ncbi:N-acetyltransferase family protein [Vannielia sp. SX4]|uniref:N-acetyltransferase family protein n=1 Tax=Vannielia sp. SX4 TaxID=3463852 RepID=UPI00405825CD
MTFEAPLPPVLRAGRAEDARALATLHVEVWRETYAGIAPPEAIARLDEAHRLPFWQALLAEGVPQSGAIVACRGDTLLGVASLAPASQAAHDGATEITHLYVRRSARGTGLGARLLLAALERIAAEGGVAAALSVVAENTRARAFYARMGGTEAERFTDPGPLWRSTNIVVRWSLSRDGAGPA